MRRDGSANGALPLFFAQVLGVKTEALTATASATIYSGGYNSSTGTRGMKGFDPGAGINGLLLPVALDVNHWNQFMANGQSPDGTVHNNANGAPEMQIYPAPKNAPGNFGLLSIGAPATSDPAFSSWIVNGPTPTDLTYLNSNNMPVSPTSPMPWTGGPGLKSNLVSDFASIMGQPRLIPLFQPVSTSPYQAASGNGSNTTYNIVGFVGVTITVASGSGSNMVVSVQSASVYDPTAIFDTSSIAPAGSISTTDTTFVGVKLTQ